MDILGLISEHYTGIFLVLVFNSVVSTMFKQSLDGSSPSMLILSLFGAILDPVSLPFYLLGILVLLMTYFVVEPDMRSMNLTPFLVSTFICCVTHVLMIYFGDGSFKLFLISASLVNIILSTISTRLSKHLIIKL